MQQVCIYVEKYYLCGVKNRKIFGIDLDVLGTWASVICAIHCALTPIVLTYGLLGGVGIFENETWDIAFILLSAILASMSLISGYTKKHHDKTPLKLALFGFLMFAIGHLVIHSNMGHVAAAFGGVVIAMAHVYNAQLLKMPTNKEDSVLSE